MRKRINGQVYVALVLTVFAIRCGGGPTAPTASANSPLAITNPPGPAPVPEPTPTPSPAPAPNPVPTTRATTWNGRGGYVLESFEPPVAELMIAVPSHGPLVVNLTFDDTRAWGTIQTGSSGAYYGEAHGYLRNDGARLEVEAPLVGPGCPDGLTISIALNMATGHADVAFHLNGGAMSGSATLAREN